MIKFIALLRAVNVGGRIVKKETLIEIFKSLGYTNVTTYIQSGNVIFETDEKSDQTSRIEESLREKMGYEVDTFIRSVDEMREIIKRNPFATREMKPTEMMYVSFMKEKPSEEIIQAVEALSTEYLHFRIIDRELYILRDREHVVKPDYDRDIVRAGLKVSSTNRNWNTVCKLGGLN